MQFEFDKSYTAMGLLDIEDIGNCAFRASNDDLQEWYKLITTKFGKTRVFTFGPLLIDSDETSLSEFCFTYNSFDYSEIVIKKDINSFLNDGRKKLKYSEIISTDEFLKHFPEIKKLIEL